MTRCWAITLVAVTLLSACDYNEIKDENKRLRAQVSASQQANTQLQNENSKLTADLSNVRAERDSIVIPVAYVKVRVTFDVTRDSGDSSAPLPRLSPVGELTGGSFTLPMVDPGTTAPNLSASGSSATLSLTFVPKDPSVLERIDLRELERLQTFRFKIRPFLDHLGMRMDSDAKVRLVLIVNGVEFSAEAPTMTSLDDAGHWDEVAVEQQADGLRQRYLAFLRGKQT